MSEEAIARSEPFEVVIGMLKIFTITFEDNVESFNDSILTNFLADKEVIKWESHFFERKNDYFWTVIIEYTAVSPSSRSVSGKTEPKREEEYKALLTENDWPLFKVLREWRGETSKKEGVPPYIIFTNMQLAKIAVTRPKSLNALQEIEGIGTAKRARYGPALLQLIASYGLPVKTGSGEGEDG